MNITWLSNTIKMILINYGANCMGSYGLLWAGFYGLASMGWLLWAGFYGLASFLWAGFYGLASMGWLLWCSNGLSAVQHSFTSHYTEFELFYSSSLPSNMKTQYINLNLASMGWLLWAGFYGLASMGWLLWCSNSLSAQLHVTLHTI